MQRHNREYVKYIGRKREETFALRKKGNNCGSSKRKTCTTTAWLGSSKRNMQISRAIALYRGGGVGYKAEVEEMG